MSGNDLLDLRAVLVRRRAALLGTLRTAVAAEQPIEPAFVALLADTHAAIAAVDAVLADPIAAAGEAP
jgi:hypothetical protein